MQYVQEYEYKKELNCLKDQPSILSVVSLVVVKNTAFTHLPIKTKQKHNILLGLHGCFSYDSMTDNDDDDSILYMTSDYLKYPLI